MGRINYNWNDVFLFTGSLRHEGNSKFGEDHKWGLFPAASAAWRVSKLPVFENSSAVDDLKLRFSYGVTGRSGFDRYTAQAKYSGFGQYYSDTYGKFIMGYGPGNNPNYDLAWEKQISYNLGIDYTLFNSRLSGSFDAFIREGRDVIGEYPVPLPPYLHDKIYANVGTTTSKGFEFQVNWDAVQTKDFSYSTNLNLAYTKSKLKSFSNEKYQLGYIEGDGFPSPGNPGSAQRLEDGIEIGSFYGFRYAGVDDAGNILIWEKGEEGGVTKLGADGNEQDKVYLDGTGVPKWELSWGNTFRYKDFDLSLFFRGRFRYKVMNQYEMYYGLQVVSGDNKLSSAYEENAHIRGRPKGLFSFRMHEIYGDFQGKVVDRDQVEPEHFKSWIEWGKEHNMKLDFNSTSFSHPKSGDLSLSNPDEGIRQFWIEHTKRCRAVAEEMGKAQGDPCIMNLWVHDGSKDITVNRMKYRALLKDSLDQIFATEYKNMKDCIESKVFGIGLESYTVGSNDFYIGYGASRNKMITLDTGHFHPTESVADKVSSLLLYVPELMLHVSRPVRWDSDHVTIMDDPTMELFSEIVRCGALDRVHYGLDYFDASINRIGAYVIGSRAAQKCMTRALLEPIAKLREYEANGQGFQRLALLEEEKALPWNAVWDMFCLKNNVPVGEDFIAEIEKYEAEVTSKR